MIKKNNKITLLILIGGKSQRMGGGVKSLLKFNNKTILNRILEKVSPQNEKIIISCNKKINEFTKYNYPIIKDVKKGFLGPLAGIHSGMDWLIKNDPKTEWLITIPSDTPFIPSDLISRFQKKMLSKFKIILAQSNRKIHPVIGAWHISLFDSLDTHLEKGTRKILSWAQLHSLGYINYNVENYDPFFNINTKEELYLASKIETKNYIKKKE